MNVVKVYGGLGNQLFQYAFGRTQMENGLDVGFNINWYNRNKNVNRPYVLDKFNTNVKTSDFLPQKDVLEKNIKYNPNLTNITSFNFYGYWQDPRYFSHIFSTLRTELKLKEEFYTIEFLRWKEIITNWEDSVSVHIRRGDFLGKVNILSLNYYISALQFCGEISKVFIFSDDINWCKMHFKNVRNHFVHLNEYLDFELMKICKHNIIANSTFSWWAATLNDNPNKIVIAPRQWRLTEESQKEMSSYFLHPEGWIIL